MTKLPYHVSEDDGGDGHRLGDVWSETFADRDDALSAAKSAAERPHLEGRDAEISYQLPEGRWQSEHVDGGDRPDRDAVDDEVGAPK
jgi:hypothetical protein